MNTLRMLSNILNTSTIKVNLDPEDQSENECENECENEDEVIYWIRFMDVPSEYRSKTRPEKSSPTSWPMLFTVRILTPLVLVMLTETTWETFSLPS